jgi:hypothetical protein
MLCFSSQDYAIARAHKAGLLVLEDCIGRFGPYVAIVDNFGLIEVHNSRAEAEARVAVIVERVAS